MNIVYAIPVAASCIEQAGATFAMWKARGYGTAALIDPGSAEPANCDVILSAAEYKGWSWAVNQLAACCDDADWIVTGGHDIGPDPTRTAEQIAAECFEHFAGTFGIMQPAGDAYAAVGSRRACVSPWIGREWCDRMYGGSGPLFDRYWHFWGDTELASVAAGLNRLWWREDVTQYHDHWMRRTDQQPAHLTRAAAMNLTDALLFSNRQAAGFPGHEPIEAVAQCA